jgi:putative acetyltransferase
LSPCLLEDVRIVSARSAEDFVAARRLFRAYADWLGVDLCFQGFEKEVAELPGAYASPAGRLLLAKVGDESAGCVALRPLDPGACEMKRLYVVPGFGGAGIGRRLAERIVEEGRAIGYRLMRLDTIPERMSAAQHVYRSLGFRQIPPYYHNPLDGVAMLELVL